MKLGLKLWSINTDYYYEEAKRLYKEGFFDYIELYVVPDTLDVLSTWAKLNIPFAIHAPHFAHNLNFSDNRCREYNFKLVKQVKDYSESLNALYTVFHPGIGGQTDETIRQMKQISDLKFLVENKPYIVNNSKTGKIGYCIGAKFEDINKIITEVNCGFCLDIGHCICTANYLKKDIYDYVNKMNELNPAVYHISDNFADNMFDKHMHLGEGSININKIIKMLNKNAYLAIETVKDSKTNLNDFEKDVKYIKEKFNEQ